ncbi:MAG: beta-propeller fold lactonase family protein, partial [Candidatus Acidiferrales bacterium]
MKSEFSIRRARTAQWLLLAAFLTLAAFISAHAAAATKDRVYIGTYTEHGSQGIYVCEFDPSTGILSPPELAAATPDPSFLAVAPDRRFLYAIN